MSDIDNWAATTTKSNDGIAQKCPTDQYTGLLLNINEPHCPKKSQTAHRDTLLYTAFLTVSCLSDILCTFLIIDI